MLIITEMNEGLYLKAIQGVLSNRDKIIRIYLGFTLTKK